MEIRNRLLLVLLMLFAVHLPGANAGVPVAEKAIHAVLRAPASCERLKYENGQLFFFRCSRHVRSTRYEVRNPLGQLLAGGRMTSSTVAVGTLDAGVYYVSLREQGGGMKMLRLVVSG